MEEHKEYPSTSQSINLGYIDDSHISEYDVSTDYIQETSFDNLMLPEFDTNEVLMRLPSRKLVSNVSSRSKTGTMKKKCVMRSRSLMYKTQRMSGNASSSEILQKLRDEDVMDGEGQMTENGIEVLREMPVNLTCRRQAMEISENQQTQGQILSYRTWMRSTIQGSWNKFKRRMNNLTYYMVLWKSPIKKIEGHFGTSVTSYFLFLKGLFLLNCFGFFFSLCFQITPQFLYRFLQMIPKGYANNTQFKASDLLTGKGWLEKTEMYYGFYTNESISLIQSTIYHMPYAYLLSSAFNYCLILGALGYSIARSYKVNYVEAGNEYTYYFVTKIFCGWDYGITSKDAAILKHKNIGIEVREYLPYYIQHDKKMLKHKCRLFFWRIFTHLLVFGMIGSSGYFIYYLSLYIRHKTSLEILRVLTVPMSISASNLILPILFTLMAHLEDYEHPQSKLYVTMVRTMLLKTANLAMLCYYWATKIVLKSQNKCWETFIGQEIYRLVLVDFFFTILHTILFELIWSILYRFKFTSKSPKFNIATATLDVIYSQGLCWLGLFYSPMMPLLMAVKLFIVFYVKWISVLHNCYPSKKTWRASRTHTIFLGFLLVNYVFTAVTLVINISFSEPSTECGPFRMFDSAYSIVLAMMNAWQGTTDILTRVIGFISRPVFISAIVVFLCVIAYYCRIMMVGRREIIKLLKYQLSMEGKDKQFLLKLLNSVKAGTADISKPSNQQSQRRRNKMKNLVFLDLFYGLSLGFAQIRCMTFGSCTDKVHGFQSCTCYILYHFVSGTSHQGWGKSIPRQYCKSQAERNIHQQLMPVMAKQRANFVSVKGLLSRNYIADFDS